MTRTVRDSAALLDAIAGPSPATRTAAPPAGAARSPPRSTPTPADCASRFSPRTATGAGPRGLRRRARRRGRAAATRSVTRSSKPTCRRSTRCGERDRHGVRRGDGWIVAYWVRELGRQPGAGELEPLTRHLWEQGRAVPAAAYLTGHRGAPALTRRVAALPRPVRRCAHSHDVGAAGSDRRDHLDRRRTDAGARARRPHHRVLRRHRQLHRQPGDVGTAVVERRRSPDRRALPRTVRRRGDAASASRRSSSGPGPGPTGCPRSRRSPPPPHRRPDPPPDEDDPSCRARVRQEA